MTLAAFTHFVFVDFENVPAVDLSLVEGKPVRVALLIGKKQTWLDLPLVQQIHRLAAQVELLEVGASGHNALDLTLACHLGQAIQRTPNANFYIVSKDKDFDPMISHLQNRGTKVSRYENLSALPFLPRPKKTGQTKQAAHLGIPAPEKTPPTDERLNKLVSRLKNNCPRPKKKASLLAHINTCYGGKLSEDEQTEKLAELIRAKILTVGHKDKVTYSRG